MALGEHATEDRLEEYCLGTVPTAELEDLEGHLLICPSCQDRLRESEAYVRTMQQATAQLAADRLTSRSRWSSLTQWMLHAAPATAIAGAAALALIWAVGPSLRQAPAIPAAAAVALEATRGGGDDGSGVHAPSRKPLLLALDVTGLAPLDSYLAQIVNDRGDAVVEIAGRPAQGRLSLSVAKGLAPGSYWIRVYDPSAAKTPLREFGLRLD